MSHLLSAKAESCSFFLGVMFFYLGKILTAKQPDRLSRLPCADGDQVDSDE
jgi:hypothetical protein